jgi:hypothetical protein
MNPEVVALLAFLLAGLYALWVLLKVKTMD